jgi:hypothetical protein
MKRILLATALVLGVVGVGAHAYQAAAATTADADQPNPPGPSWGVGPRGPGPMMPAPGGPMGGPMYGGWHHPHDDMFSLFARVQNKNLSAADVKTIAQGILLMHGNHDWTVTNVATASSAIDFSYATQHGDIVATFAVDPASGHIKRVS